MKKKTHNGPIHVSLSVLTAALSCELGKPHDLESLLENTVATMGIKVIAGHVVAIVRTKVIIGQHCFNNGNRSHRWLTKMTSDDNTTVAFETIIAFIIPLE
jgi:hypothetical protein